MTEGSSIEERKKRRRKKKIKRRVKQVLFFILFFVIIAMVYHVLHQKLEPKPYTVGLDPGHGGEDTGAIGYIKEIELTEKTVDLLEERFKKDGRFEVIRSRKNGETIEITKRKQIFLKNKVDFILSIHGNSDPTGTARGFECYPSPLGRKNHQESYDFAVCIAQNMAQAGSQLRGINGIRYGYYVKDENGNTKKVIKEADDTMVYAQPSFGILEDVDCPAVLAEQCFVTNLEDVEAFASEKGCALAAEAYYKAVCEYLGIEEMQKK